MQCKDALFKKPKEYADGGCHVSMRILFLVPSFSVLKYLTPKFHWVVLCQSNLNLSSDSVLTSRIYFVLTQNIKS